MENQVVYRNIGDWVDDLLTTGKNAFSLEQVRNAFPRHTETAIKRSLNRLSEKRKIVSVHKGFYVIISYEHANRGIVPPVLYIDNLMKYLERPYYVALLSAAALYGASHQAPQIFMVITVFPALRSSEKRNSKIIYISIKEIPLSLLEKKKTESGYIQVSSPELTALDLVKFEKHVGGLDRVGTVLSELAEYIKVEKLDDRWADYATVSTLQRLGYFFDLLKFKKLSDKIEQVCKNKKLKFYRIPLKSSGKRNGYSVNERWQIIENTTIETD